jgi:uncharacterized protein YbjT (DUF2867 family)
MILVKKIIAVLGATGSQGGGLVRSILNDRDGDFVVRAITRDPESEKAKQLALMGAEVVAGDLDDVKSLAKAFEDAYGLYAVTFFWDHFSVEKEIGHIKTIAVAAKAANVQHVIWSTLEDTRKWIPLSDNRMPTLMGKYKVPHFDGKGESDRFFINAGLQTTFLLASFYWDNFIKFGMGPKRRQDGKLALVFPLRQSKLAGIVAEDIGKCAYSIFKAGPSKYAGKYVGVSGEHLTGEQIAHAFARVLGEDVTYSAVPADLYRGFGFPGAEDLGNMFQFNDEFEQVFLAARDIENTRKLNPDLQSLEDWLISNKNYIHLE